MATRCKEGGLRDFSSSQQPLRLCSQQNGAVVGDTVPRFGMRNRYTILLQQGGRLCTMALRRRVENSAVVGGASYRAHNLVV